MVEPSWDYGYKNEMELWYLSFKLDLKKIKIFEKDKSRDKFEMLNCASHGLWVLSHGYLINESIYADLA